MGAASDVTAVAAAKVALRESKERQAFLLKLSDAVRPLGDPAEIQGETTRLLREQLNAGWCYYVDWNLDKKLGLVLHDSANEGLPSLAGAHDVSDAPEFLQLQADGTVLNVSDYASFEPLSTGIRQKFVTLGFRSMMAAPLVKESRLIASLIVGDTEIRDWSASEMALLVEVADRTWAAIERARAEDAFRDSDQKFRALFDTIDEGMAIQEIVYDKRGEIVDVIYQQVNAAFERQAGIHDAVGRSIFELLPGVEKYWLDHYKQVTRTGQQIRVENHQQDVGRWFEVFFSRVDEAGRYVVTVFNDISERKRAEAVLREGQERQAFLLKLSDALREEPNANAVANRAVRMLLDHLRLDRSYITYYRPADDAADFPYQVGNDTVPPLPPTARLSDFPDAYEHVREKTYVIDDDFERRGLSKAERANSKALGMRAMVASTVRKGEKNPLCSLVAVSSTPRHWTLSEVALVEEAAERTWAAVERARAEAVLRDSEERQTFLLKLSDALRAASDDTILDRAIELLADELQLDLCYIVEVHTDDDRADVVCQLRRGDMPGVPDVIRLSDYPEALRQWLDRTLVSDDMAEDPALSEVDRRNVSAMRFAGLIAAPVRRGAGNPIWSIVAVTAQPRRWTAGEVALVEDMAERTWAAAEGSRAEAALQASEKRFRQFGEASSDVLWIVDAATGRLEYLSPAFDRMWGVPRAEAMTDLSRWTAMLHPEDRARALTALPRALAGESVLQEYRIVRGDGAVRYITDIGFPIFGDDGRVVRVGGIAQDLTERRRAEAAVRASEQQLQLLMEGVPQLVWRAVDGGHWTWASPQWTAFTGQAEADSHGRGWLDPVHPDDRQGVMEIWQGAIERGEFHADYRLCEATQGIYRWFQARATAVRDDDGAVVEWLGTSTDVDDLRQLQDRQKILVAELQHRTFNLMGMIRSLADATIGSSATLDEFQAKFRNRVAALARVQRLLSRLDDDDRVTFDELVRGELEAVGALPEEGARVVLDGPSGVALRSSTVQTFAMALHELVTNAVKHGALKYPDARLSIRWRVAEEGAQRWLHVDWRETGVAMPPAQAATHRSGQGRTLIERALPYQLRARTSYDLAEDGVRCTIALPVSARSATEAQRVLS